MYLHIYVVDTQKKFKAYSLEYKRGIRCLLTMYCNEKNYERPLFRKSFIFYLVQNPWTVGKIGFKRGSRVLSKYISRYSYLYSE